MKIQLLIRTVTCLFALVCMASIHAQTFTDVTVTAGIIDPDGTKLTHDGASATDVMGLGSGAAWFDYDNDGDLDLYVTMRTGANKLYQNNAGSSFTDVAVAAGVADQGGDGAGVVVGDIDNDGDMDLFLNNCHQNKLYENSGAPNYTFTDITTSSGLGAILGDRRGTSASFGDYNEDGYLDIYVAHHFMTNGTQLEADRKDFLIYNNTDNTFTDVSSLLPYNDLIGFGFIGGWTDFDEDGDLDIIVINDCEPIGSQYNFPTKVFRNDGGTNPVTGWNFTEVGVSVGIDDCRNGMGIAIGDYNRDGDLDVFYTNIGDVVLFESDGDGTFTDATSGSGLDIQNTLDYSWGTTFVDYDLDGYQDIFVALGELHHTEMDDRPNQMFKNNGDGTFTNNANALGIDDPQKSRNGIFGDYDADGDLDLFLVNYSGEFCLFRNDVPAANHHYLHVYPEGDVSNLDGIGSKVRIVHGSPAINQVFEVRSGSNLGGGEEIGAFFGLGTDTTVDSVIVTFLSGEVVVQTNVGADQKLVINEAAPLAVDLVNFDANKKEKEVLLEWTTFSETENKSFDIERSNDGRSFESIGFVLGGGTTEEVRNYNFIDERPLEGDNYYRLLQTDYDGKETFSEIRMVEFPLETTEIAIAPNPVTKGMFTVNYSGAEEELNIELFDVFGKLLQRDLIQNKETKELNVSNLPNGLYVLRLSGRLIHQSEKMLISQ